MCDECPFIAIARCPKDCHGNGRTFNGIFFRSQDIVIDMKKHKNTWFICIFTIYRIDSRKRRKKTIVRGAHKQFCFEVPANLFIYVDKKVPPIVKLPIDVQKMNAKQ